VVPLTLQSQLELIYIATLPKEPGKVQWLLKTFGLVFTTVAVIFFNWFTLKPNSTSPQKINKDQNFLDLALFCGLAQQPIHFSDI